MKRLGLLLPLDEMLVMAGYLSQLARGGVVSVQRQPMNEEGVVSGQHHYQCMDRVVSGQSQPKNED